ncbi:hypothetical protein [Williamsia sp. DF01-3]|uniref:hypothetical protein n=1 Tax=Williamsia sp. DF01-3 TaxID=2934157 RepID=UPI001FF4BA28|nr:hypothetical protein [Williamsia sp. DF01-3]MCK0515665.1 hypothetical protein [Williamsia sp. DF01-3]
MDRHTEDSGAKNLGVRQGVVRCRLAFRIDPALILVLDILRRPDGLIGNAIKVCGRQVRAIEWNIRCLEDERCDEKSVAGVTGRPGCVFGVAHARIDDAYECDLVCAVYTLGRLSDLADGRATPGGR